jgi:hypothetical protein
MEKPFDDMSSFDTVFLSTRITQVEHDMLTEIQGWLQTENQTATIRKQETVRRTIRMAYEYLQTQIAHMDEPAEKPQIHLVDNSPTIEKPVDIPPTKPTQQETEKYLKDVYEMSNNYKYSPRTQNTHNKKPHLIQKTLNVFE